MNKSRSGDVNKLVLGHTTTKGMSPSNVIPEHELLTSVLYSQFLTGLLSPNMSHATSAYGYAWALTTNLSKYVVVFFAWYTKTLCSSLKSHLVIYGHPQRLSHVQPGTICSCPLWKFIHRSHSSKLVCITTEAISGITTIFVHITAPRGNLSAFEWIACSAC